MDYSQALYEIKKGKKLARKGWNGKNMFIYYVPEGGYPAHTDIARELENIDGLVPYEAYIAIRTVRGTVVPWLCSQTDMLAEDWYIVE